MNNRKITMAKRPSGMLEAADFKLVEERLPPLQENQVLIKVLYTLIDPIIRGWMVNWFGFTEMNPGDLIPAMGVGRIVESRNPALPVDAIVSGMYGWQDYAITDGKRIALDSLQYGEQRMPIRSHDPELPLTYPIGVLGISTMTAYFGVKRDGPPVPGKSYLVSGAAGSVGSVAGQIAKMEGGYVIGMAGTDEKCRWLTEDCGFDAAINYREQNLDARLKELCPDGVQVFFDNVGGPILDTVLDNLAIGATIVICGATATYNAEGDKPEWGPRNYFNLCLKRAVMKGTYCIDFYEEYPQAQEQVAAWLKEGKLVHQETITDGLENCPESLIKLFQGDSIGKYFVRLASE